MQSADTYATMAEYEQALADEENETPDETFKKKNVDKYDYDDIYYNDNSALNF